jgi:hypothetical protein
MILLAPIAIACLFLSPLVVELPRVIDQSHLARDPVIVGTYSRRYV